MATNIEKKALEHIKNLLNEFDIHAFNNRVYNTIIGIDIQDKRLKENIMQIVSQELGRECDRQVKPIKEAKDWLNSLIESTN